MPLKYGHHNSHNDNNRLPFSLDPWKETEKRIIQGEGKRKEREKIERESKEHRSIRPLDVPSAPFLFIERQETTQTEILQVHQQYSCSCSIKHKDNEKGVELK